MPKTSNYYICFFYSVKLVKVKVFFLPLIGAQGLVDIGLAAICVQCPVLTGHFHFNLFMFLAQIFELTSSGMIVLQEKLKKIFI